MRSPLHFIVNVASPALCISATLYLSYGAFFGASGFRALIETRREISAEEMEVRALRDRRERLAHAAGLLKPQALDPDMVEEKIRSVLGYAAEGELIVPRDELDRLIERSREAGDHSDHRSAG